MNIRRILGVIVFICGFAMLLVAVYINKQVEGGRHQVASAEKKVKKANALFSLTPATKELGQGLTGSADKKIAEGKEEIAYYARLADQLHIGSLVIMGTALIIILIPRKTKK